MREGLASSVYVRWARHTLILKELIMKTLIEVEYDYEKDLVNKWETQAMFMKQIRKYLADNNLQITNIIHDEYTTEKRNP